MATRLLVVQSVYDQFEFIEERHSVFYVHNIAKVRRDVYVGVEFEHASFSGM